MTFYWIRSDRKTVVGKKLGSPFQVLQFFHLVEISVKRNESGSERNEIGRLPWLEIFIETKTWRFLEVGGNTKSGRKTRIVEIGGLMQKVKVLGERVVLRQLSMVTSLWFAAYLKIYQ